MNNKSIDNYIHKGSSFLLTLTKFWIFSYMMKNNSKILLSYSYFIMRIYDLLFYQWIKQLPKSQKHFFFIFREHKNSMIKLKKILSNERKYYRSHRNILTIQITMLGWIVEWLGFLVVALGVFILGRENSNVTQIMQTIAILFYAILLPCTILINSQ